MKRKICVIFMALLSIVVYSLFSPSVQGKIDGESWKTVAQTNPTFNGTLGAYGLADMIPYGVTTDPEGNMYISDEYQFRTLKFNSSGHLLCTWGTFGKKQNQFVLHKEIEYYEGRLYVVDKYNHRIQVFNSDGNFLFKWGRRTRQTPPELGNFWRPEGIAINRTGFVYIVEMWNNRIQVFNSSGDFEFVAVDNGCGKGDGQLNHPRGIDVDTDGNIYVADVKNHRIQKFSSNGTFLRSWGRKGTGNGQFNMPYGVAVDSNSNVYVSDTWNHRIQKFDLRGNFLKAWGGYGKRPDQFHAPKGIWTDEADNVYVADPWNYRVQKFDPEGNLLMIVGGNGPPSGKFNDPRSIAIDGKGDIYVGEAWNHRIQKFASNGTFMNLEFGGPPPKRIDPKANGTLNYPKGIALSSDDRIYVADCDNQRIAVFYSNGTYLFSWGKWGKDSGEFKKPWDVALGRDGNVYVADSGNQRIQVFDHNGKYLFSFNGNGRIAQPRSIAVDPSTFEVYVSCLWAVNNSVPMIQKYTYNGTFICGWGQDGKGNGEFRRTYNIGTINFGLSVDSLGRVYVADTGNHRIQVFDSDGKYLTQWGQLNVTGRGAYDFYYPSWVEVAPDGRIYVSDTFHHRIQVFNSLPHARITITKVWTNKAIYKRGDNIVIEAIIKEDGIPLVTGTVKTRLYANGLNGKENVLIATLTMTLVDSTVGKWRATYGPIPGPDSLLGFEGTYVVRVTAEHPHATSATRVKWIFVAYRADWNWPDTIVRFSWAKSPSRILVGQNFEVKAIIKNPSGATHAIRVMLILPSGMTLVSGLPTQDIALEPDEKVILTWTLKSTTANNKFVKINVLKDSKIVAKLHWYIRDP